MTRPTPTAGAPSRVFPAVVESLERLSPSFVRVTFAGEELRDLAPGGPDQRIKLIVPLPGSRVSTLPDGADWYSVWRRLDATERNPMRTYTIRGVASGRLVVDVVAHGDTGPASRWIARAEVGDRLLVVGPDGSSRLPVGGSEWHPGAATTLLVAGDETAVPAACRILESLPADARGAVFLEVPTAADALDVRGPAGVDVHWLARKDGPGGGAGGGAGGVVGSRLTPAVRAWAADHLAPVGDGRPGAGPAEEPGLLNPGTELLWEVPSGPADGGYAWLAGEAGVITGLRRHLVRDLGIDRSRVAFMGYWKLGRPEN